MARAQRISIALTVLLVTLAFAIVPPSTAASPLPRVIMEIQDTVVTAGSDGFLNVYLYNYTDTIAGVRFELFLDRPDLVTFDVGGPGFDTSGTLMSGWEAVAVRDTSGESGAMIRLSALADFGLDTIVTPGIPPQNGDVLVRLPISISLPAPSAGTQVCNISLESYPEFSDPDANLIGIVTDTLTDTIYWQCTQWDGDSCVTWEAVDGNTQPFDSVEIYDYYVGSFDTTQVVALIGAIVVDPAFSPLTCDLNNDERYSILDLTCLVSHLFGSLDPVTCPNVRCDCDTSGNDPEQPNVADLTCLVAYLFKGGPVPGGN